MSYNYKFRAVYKGDEEVWHEDRKLFFYTQIIDEKLMFVLPDNPDFAYPFWVPFYDDAWYVMQYTGVNDDKNNVPVYESDIVKVVLESSIERVTEIVAVKRTTYRWDCGFYPFTTRLGYKPIEVERIGDIYRTPELLP